ncbi:MAG: N-acetylneuraminate synthase family protein [Actinobacteria bacterium]|nr:N-acetylneuraminate synthase family protein [Actinomycetota bacterium]MBE3114630.1 N-acetylneuraminate synthase family protein [Actinomycetota bacterium]
MKEVKIGNKVIGKNHPVFIIAEIAENHLGNIDLAKAMVDSAKDCGVDAVKFQHYIVDETMLRDVPKSDNFKEPLYDIITRMKLSIEHHREVKEYCDSKDIVYLCTPFGLTAAKEIRDLVPIIKIGSGEFTDLPYLEIVAGWNKPMILSTGMSTIEEIDMVYKRITEINDNIILLNCTSEYPPIYEDINLNFIKELVDKYDTIIGHSDHTPDIYTSIAAVVMGAKIIEKHFMLDNNVPGPDNLVSLTPEQLKSMVDGIRKVEKALINKSKVVYDKELQIRIWARRSIVSIKDIKKDEILTYDNIWSKRPGTGIPSFRILEVVNKMAKRDISKDTILDWNDFE